MGASNMAHVNAVRIVCPGLDPRMAASDTVYCGPPVPMDHQNCRLIAGLVLMSACMAYLVLSSRINSACGADLEGAPLAGFYEQAWWVTLRWQGKE